MNRVIAGMLRRYDTASFELRERARLFIILCLMVVPILFVFLVLMNVLQSRNPFEILNLVVVGIIVLMLSGLFLISRGFYNAAVNIFALAVMAGLILNALATDGRGSGGRFVASMFAFMIPIFFSILFCRRWTYVAVSAMGLGGTVYCTVISQSVEPEVKGIILGSMGVTLVISFIIGYILNRLNETAKRIRTEESERESRRQSDINEALAASMRDVSRRLDESSRELSGNAAGFARNIQNQAASIEEITATMEEISAGSDNVSSGARVQSEAMARLAGMMDELSRITGEMAGRIGETLERTGKIAAMARTGEEYIIRMDRSMTEVSETSKEMSGILSMINDISDRINLLSLNAAIEAARAGEYGRGFAVVADEISKLADQTSTSVKDIATLIRKSDEEVRKGAAGVQDTVAVIRDILAGVEESNSMIAGVNAGMSSYIQSNRNAHDEVRGSEDEVR